MNEDLYIKHKNYYLNKKDNYKKISYLLANASAQLLLAPLYVISISKQLSVTEHKNIYYDFLGTKEEKIEKIPFAKKIQMLFYTSTAKEKEKEKGKTEVDTLKERKNNNKLEKIGKVNNEVKIIDSKKKAIQNLEGTYSALTKNEGESRINKIKNPITIRDHINKNLVEASGVPEGQTPYRAAIFDNYIEMLKSYNKQGLLSFWKGTLMRILFTSCSFSLSGHLYNIFKEKINRITKSYSYSVDLINLGISLSIAETMFHPLFLLENRYVLQNRLPHFRVYQSYFTVSSRAYMDLYNFCSVHYMKNFCIFSSYYFLNIFFKSDSTNNMIIISFMSASITYPLFTVMRRLVCQDIKTAGMIPNRYYNLIHGLALIRKEEGFKNGLYKGFLPFAIAHVLYLNYNPVTDAHIYSRYLRPLINPFINDESIDEFLMEDISKNKNNM